MNNPFLNKLTYLFCYCLFFSLATPMLGQNSCDQVQFSTLATKEIQVTGMVAAEPFAIYAFDSELATYTTFCVNDCGASKLINLTSIPEADQLLVYYNGFFCKATTISDTPTEKESCSITFTNEGCKPIHIYETMEQRFIGRLRELFFPTPPIPNYVPEPGGIASDPIELPFGETRTYSIFNGGQNIETATPLQIINATCEADTIVFGISCVDVPAYYNYVNVGCDTLSFLNSNGVSDLLLPGEERAFGANGFETIRFSVGDQIILEDTIYQLGGVEIIEIDSGGAKDENGNCLEKEEAEIPIELEPDCESIEILKTNTGLLFSGLVNAPITQVYVYNATARAYVFNCYNNCPPNEINVEFDINTDQYLLGVIYYSADGTLLCFKTEEIN